MTISASLDQYRLRRHALSLRRFTTGELRAVAGVSAATVHNFVKNLREEPGDLIVEHTDADTSSPRGVGRPPRRFELTRGGIAYLVERNLEIAARLNEEALAESPAPEPVERSDRTEGSAAVVANGLTPPPSVAPAIVLLAAELQKGLAHQASALYLGAGQPTTLRVGHGIERLGGDHVWTLDELSRIIVGLLTPWQKDRLNLRGALSCTYESSAQGLMVVRVFREGGGVGLELRRPPVKVPSLADLDLPPLVGQFCTRPTGFVFVSGPADSGRIPALAAMMNHINEERSVRIVSIEEPTVFRHRNKKGLVSQRQVGVDTPDFSTGVREALRESVVDVLVLTDVSDHLTVEMALDASRHALVICRVDAPDIAEAIGALVQLLPSDEQSRGRTILAERLIGGISLSPCSAPEHSRKVMVVKADQSVRELILDSSRTALLRNAGDPLTGALRVSDSQPVQA